MIVRRKSRFNNKVPKVVWSKTSLLPYYSTDLSRIKSLSKYRRLPAFNRDTGERERRDRRNVKNWARKDAFNRAFNYPTNNNRTRSLSKRSFAKQTRDLKTSQYFIDQYRGGLQDNYRLQRTTLPWSPDLDLLSYQARNLLNKEEQERAKPIRTFFDDLVNNRNPTVQNDAVKRE